MTSNDLDGALGALAELVERTGAKLAAIGGIAVIARGVPRTTADVDVTVDGEGIDLDQFLIECRSVGLEPRLDDSVAFARRSQSLLLRHASSGTPVDVAIAWLPFEREAIARAEKVAFGGASLPTVRAEDLVIYKLVAARPRDLDDARRLVTIHGDAIDYERVRAVVTEFAEALEDPTRIANIAQVFGGRAL